MNINCDEIFWIFRYDWPNLSQFAKFGNAAASEIKFISEYFIKTHCESHYQYTHTPHGVLIILELSVQRMGY
jgi:hypothetical protein